MQGAGPQTGGQQGSTEFDVGLAYGGAARHDHGDQYVGTDRTFGPSEQSQGQQGSADDWQARHREYPVESEGHEEYGHGHHHEASEEYSPIGRPFGDDEN